MPENAPKIGQPIRLRLYLLAIYASYPLAPDLQNEPSGRTYAAFKLMSIGGIYRTIPSNLLLYHLIVSCFVTR